MANVLKLPSRTQLLDLPDEVLDMVFRYLDVDSRFSFMRTHSRLNRVFRDMRRVRIESRHVCANLLLVVAINRPNIRVLVLTNCHSASTLIMDVIVQCRFLEDLNTVNSGLLTRHLLACLVELRRLKALSFSALDQWSLEACVEENSALETVYAECNEVSYSTVAALVNVCENVKKLHIRAIMMGVSDSSVKIRSERWQKLQTVTLTVRCSPVDREAIFDSVFANQLSYRDTHLMQITDTVSLDNEFVYERTDTSADSAMQISSSASKAAANFRVSDRVYSINSFHYGDFAVDPIRKGDQPRILYIRSPSFLKFLASIPPCLATLSTLTGLILDVCLPKFPKGGWEEFFRSLPTIESLKVPMCFFPADSSEDMVSDFASYSQFIPGQSTRPHQVRSPLEELKVKKLVVTKACCYQGWTLNSHNQTLYNLNHLQELTVCDQSFTPRLLSWIANPKMRLLRISNVQRMLYSDYELFGEFLGSCENLRFLSLSSPSLDLSSTRLWEALGSKANLEQLCLETAETERMDLTIFRSMLPKVCHGLEVLHFHAPYFQNFEAFRSLVEAQVARMNFFREHNFLHLSILPEVIETPRRFSMSVPGRGLCAPNFAFN